MKIKVFLLFIFITLVSCKNQDSIGDVFVTESNEYWQYYTGKYSGPAYFIFNKNKTSDDVKLEKDKIIVMKSSGDIELKPAKWSVSADSILTWDERKYDIVSFSDKLILLYIQGKNETNGNIDSGFIYLIKGTLDNVRKEPGYFSHKRELYPEKYKHK